MNASTGFPRRAGEFETEVCLPVRLQYELDESGQAVIVAVIPLPASIPETVRLDLSALSLQERRALQTLAQQDAARQEASALRDRDFGLRESESYFRPVD